MLSDNQNPCYPSVSIESDPGPPHVRFRPLAFPAGPRQANRALDAPQAVDRVEKSAAASSPWLDAP
jgi:hypothetical protein